MTQDDKDLSDAVEANSVHPDVAHPDVEKLRRQLQARDHLIEQLSAELFRMVKTHPPLLPGSNTAPTTAALVPATVEDALRADLRRLEEQIEFYQSQIDKRDQEISRLQKSCQALSDRNQMLERIIQELPEVYRQKFSDRLNVVKSKVQSLQSENRRLQGELQQVNPLGLPEGRSRRDDR